MPVFKDFNRRHGRQIGISTLTYFGVGLAIGAINVVLGQPTVRVLSITLLGLCVAHLVRIYQISLHPDLDMTTLQKLWLLLATIVVVLPMLSFGYASTSEADTLSYVNFKRIVLPMLLATVPSIWIDFYVAEIVAKVRRMKQSKINTSQMS